VNAKVNAMKVEYLSELDVRFQVNPDKGRRWQLIAPFRLKVDGSEFEVPPLFWTDFASIPRLLWPIISPYDIGKGPIIHDYGYFTGIGSKAFWDTVLTACMETDKITPWKLSPVYHAVDWFGGPVWNDYRKQGSTTNQLDRLKMRSL